jgi:nucleoid-associated protein YgaU
MQGIGFDRRRSGSPGRLFGGRGFVQVLVGALAIAAIVLAFSSNSVEAPTELKNGAAAKPTGVPAAVVPLATATTTSAPTSAPQQAQVATKEQSGTGERVHEVVSGDTLAKIAIQYYGDEREFQKIFEANRDILETPDSLQVGQKLKIPD